MCIITPATHLHTMYTFNHYILIHLRVYMYNLPHTHTIHTIKNLIFSHMYIVHEHVIIQLSHALAHAHCIVNPHYMYKCVHINSLIFQSEQTDKQLHRN